MWYYQLANYAYNVLRTLFLLKTVPEQIEKLGDRVKDINSWIEDIMGSANPSQIGIESELNIANLQAHSIPTASNLLTARAIVSAFNARIANSLEPSKVKWLKERDAVSSTLSIITEILGTFPQDELLLIKQTAESYFPDDRNSKIITLLRSEMEHSLLMKTSFSAIRRADSNLPTLLQRVEDCLNFLEDPDSIAPSAKGRLLGIFQTAAAKSLHPISMEFSLNADIKPRSDVSLRFVLDVTRFVLSISAPNAAAIIDPSLHIPPNLNFATIQLPYYPVPAEFAIVNPLPNIMMRMISDNALSTQGKLTEDGPSLFSIVAIGLAPERSNFDSNLIAIKE